MRRQACLQAIFCLAVAGLLGGCETPSSGGGGTSKLPGSSAADAMLQRDALQMVWLLEAVAEEECDERRVIDTRVTVPPEVVGKSPWSEEWIVDRCGKQLTYTVDFTPTPERGGTDFKVHKAEE
jgi:hypothetical protein